MAISVHIIDSSKPSLVMTSEVFKDKIPGSTVSFSLTAKDGVAYLMAKEGKGLPDALVVDFNLPDADGVTLIKELRKFYRGPIFMTAHPDKIVDQAVQEELFHYHDACCWIPKPVRFEVLEKRIEQFVVNRHRLGKRFDVDFMTHLVGKGEGRGKRAPKFNGRALNISMGGLCVAFNHPAKLKRDEEFVVTMGVPSGVIEGSSPISVLKPLLAEQKAAAAAAAKALKVAAKSIASKVPAKGKMTPAAKAKLEAQQRKEAELAAEKLAASVQLSQSLSNQKIEEYKIRATVAWTADAGKKIGLQFAKVPDAQRRQIESFLKGLCT
jgi:CheY-like chemotaxis protein